MKPVFFRRATESGRLSFRYVLLLAFALTLLIAGCGGDTSAQTGAESVPVPPGAIVLRKGNGAEPETLDPQKARGVPAANILRDLYEGLVSEAPDGHLVPGVAERWSVSGDGLTYTFYLRPNARWSNGKPLTAQDFVYSLRRAVDPATGSVYAMILTPIAGADAIIHGEQPPNTLGVKALDAHTLRIHLMAPTAYFLQLLTHPISYPVYRPAVERYAGQFTQPGHSVTDGAYRMRAWVPYSVISLERNPHYWNNARTRIDVVDYYPIDNAEAEFRRYQAGELDWTETVPTNELDRVRREMPAQLHISPAISTYYYGFNVTGPPFENKPKLRRALSMAIDREWIVKNVTRGGEQPAYAWVPPKIKNYTSQTPEWAGWPRSRQIAEARRLYREAGYSAAHPLDVEIRYNTSENHRKIAVVIARMWEDVLGVRTTLVNEEWKVFLHNREAKKITQVFRAGWVGDYDDASTFLDLLLSDSGLNDEGYSNPQYDEPVRQAAREGNPVKRRALLERAERVMLRDQPVLPIYFYVNKHLIQPYVKGYHGNVMDHHYTKDLYIQRGRFPG